MAARHRPPLPRHHAAAPGPVHRRTRDPPLPGIPPPHGLPVPGDPPTPSPGPGRSPLPRGPANCAHHPRPTPGTSGQTLRPPPSAAVRSPGPCNRHSRSLGRRARFCPSRNCRFPCGGPRAQHCRFPSPGPRTHPFPSSPLPSPRPRAHPMTQPRRLAYPLRSLPRFPLTEALRSPTPPADRPSRPRVGHGLHLPGSLPAPATTPRAWSEAVPLPARRPSAWSSAGPWPAIRGTPAAHRADCPPLLSSGHPPAHRLIIRGPVPGHPLVRPLVFRWSVPRSSAGPSLDRPQARRLIDRRSIAGSSADQSRGCLLTRRRARPRRWRSTSASPPARPERRDRPMARASPAPDRCSSTLRPHFPSNASSPEHGLGGRGCLRVVGPPEKASRRGSEVYRRELHMR